MTHAGKQSLRTARVAHAAALLTCILMHLIGYTLAYMAVILLLTEPTAWHVVSAVSTLVAAFALCFAGTRLRRSL